MTPFSYHKPNSGGGVLIGARMSNADLAFGTVIKLQLQRDMQFTGTARTGSAGTHWGNRPHSRT
ncbi:hypothetical protein [Pseudomonas sp. A014]|uniref:hypothetical protein n=1 Tax=Pseudomonas sp. A014 TaxID=3458058 RepID=UPI004037233A